MPHTFAVTISGVQDFNNGGTVWHFSQINGTQPVTIYRGPRGCTYTGPTKSFAVDSPGTNTAQSAFFIIIRLLTNVSANLNVQGGAFGYIVQISPATQNFNCNQTFTGTIVPGQQQFGAAAFANAVITFSPVGVDENTPNPLSPSGKCTQCYPCDFCGNSQTGCNCPDELEATIFGFGDVAECDASTEINTLCQPANNCNVMNGSWTCRFVTTVGNVCWWAADIPFYPCGDPTQNPPCQPYYVAIAVTPSNNPLAPPNTYTMDVGASINPQNPSTIFKKLFTVNVMGVPCGTLNGLLVPQVTPDNSQPVWPCTIFHGSLNPPKPATNPLAACSVTALGGTAGAGKTNACDGTPTTVSLTVSGIVNGPHNSYPCNTLNGTFPSVPQPQSPVAGRDSCAWQAGPYFIQPGYTVILPTGTGAGLNTPTGQIQWQAASNDCCSVATGNLPLIPPAQTKYDCDFTASTVTVTPGPTTVPNPVGLPPVNPAVCGEACGCEQTDGNWIMPPAEFDVLLSGIGNNQCSGCPSGVYTLRWNWWTAGCLWAYDNRDSQGFGLVITLNLFGSFGIFGWNIVLELFYYCSSGSWLPFYASLPFQVTGPGCQVVYSQPLTLTVPVIPGVVSIIGAGCTPTNATVPMNLTATIYPVPAMP